MTFASGSSIVVREVLHGAVWATWREVVESDDGQTLGTVLVEGTPMRFPEHPVPHPWGHLDAWQGTTVLKLREDGAAPGDLKITNTALKELRYGYKVFAGYPNVRKVTVFGVSRDSLKSHEGFKAKFRFPFELIADPDESLCNEFDVIRDKNMYGKKVRGIERSTFLVDENGVLLREWRKVRVDGHAREVLDSLEEFP